MFGSRIIHPPSICCFDRFVSCNVMNRRTVSNTKIKPSKGHIEGQRIPATYYDPINIQMRILKCAVGRKPGGSDRLKLVISNSARANILSICKCLAWSEIRRISVSSRDENFIEGVRRCIFIYFSLSVEGIESGRDSHGEFSARFEIPLILLILSLITRLPSRILMPLVES